MTYGFSPILHFELPLSEEMDEIVEKAKNNFKCSMDGDIIEDEY